MSHSFEVSPALRQEIEAASADPKRHFGRFLVLSQIGAGGMGVVCRAWDGEIHRVVALKTLLPGNDGAAVKRFHREAEAMARVRHPNIVSVFESGELEGKHYLVMDFVDGKTLFRRVKPPRGPTGTIDHGLTVRAAAAILRDVGRAIHHAHEEGVIHRDLKPQNILVDAHDRPFVVDFGIARVLDSRSKLTKTGTTLGTPGYMSPEQIDGDLKAMSERSDVYSLGATLYFALTGHAPFEAQSEVEILTAVLTRDPEPPGTLNGQVSADLDTICMHCLEKEPSRRYESAEAFARDLDHFLAGEPIEARPTGTATLILRRAWKHKLAAAVGVLVLAAVAATAQYVLTLAAEKELAEKRAADLEAKQEKPTPGPSASEKPRVEKPVASAPWKWERKIDLGAPGSPAGGDMPHVVWDGQRLIALGGQISLRSSNALDWFDPKTGAWTAKIAAGDASAPPPRHAASFAWDGERALLFGGVEFDGGNARVVNDLWAYDPRTNAWEQLVQAGDPNGPGPRFGAGMLWDGRRIILFGGGIDAQTVHNDLWFFDRASRAWTQMIADADPRSPPARWCYSGFTWTGKRALLFGGSDSVQTFLDDLWSYDPETSTWTGRKYASRETPPGRVGHGQAWDGTNLLVFGGLAANNAKLNDLWAYDPAQDAWKQRIQDGAPGSPPGRTGCALVATSSAVYLFGGWTFGLGSETFMNDLWVYRP